MDDFFVELIKDHEFETNNSTESKIMLSHYLAPIDGIVNVAEPDYFLSKMVEIADKDPKRRNDFFKSQRFYSTVIKQIDNLEHSLYDQTFNM